MSALRSRCSLPNFLRRTEFRRDASPTNGRTRSSHTEIWKRLATRLEGYATVRDTRDPLGSELLFVVMRRCSRARSPTDRSLKLEVHRRFSMFEISRVSTDRNRFSRCRIQFRDRWESREESKLNAAETTAQRGAARRILPAWLRFAWSPLERGASFSVRPTDRALRRKTP